MAGQAFVTLPVSTDEAEMSVRKNRIRGFDALRRQMHSAYDYLWADAPDKIFALGGGCDADAPTIVYLCEKYRGDLSVIWLDTHGDLNAPEESTSSLFYGMPLRAVMHDNCYGLLENRSPLIPSHILHIGGRDLDDAEKAFITAVMLLILEVIRKCVSIAKAKGMKLFEKFKERKGANEADKKEN